MVSSESADKVMSSESVAILQLQFPECFFLTYCVSILITLVTTFDAKRYERENFFSKVLTNIIEFKRVLFFSQNMF